MTFLNDLDLYIHTSGPDSDADHTDQSDDEAFTPSDQQVSISCTIQGVYVCGVVCLYVRLPVCTLSQTVINHLFI